MQTATRQSGLPRYLEIAARLRRDLASGRWQPGERLPSITDFAREFGVTPVTAREAVKVVESLGHERHLFVDLWGNNIICRQSSEDAAPAVGERVELSVKPEHVHLFDPESTERVN